jgi:hypothetical protein
MASVVVIGLSAAGAPGEYKVEVIESPAGEAAATFRLDTAEIIDALDDLQETLLASSVSRRRVLDPGEHRVREVGLRLFEALFSDPAIIGVYRASCAVAAERGDSLRVMLRLNAPELAALPWECAFDPETDSYISRREPLVRHVPVPSSPPPLAVRRPLRILALIASPQGLEALDVTRERENLMSALAPSIERGDVMIEWVEHVSWPALQDTLLGGDWHVVHFIGHGGFDVARDEGMLAFETDAGRLHRVPAEHLVDLLREARPMPRLVVLNACETAKAGHVDLFSGTAATLVRGGVCAVTAMQFEISDDAAICFCRGFYTAIARGRSIDEAVRSGRVAILGMGARSLEWMTPTLYLRGTESRLFAVEDAGEDPAVERRDAPAPREAPAPDPPAPDPPAPDPPAPDPARPPRRARDRTGEVWAVAKGVPWEARPLKSHLGPIASMLDQGEQVVGCVRVPFSLTSSCALVITDHNIHLGAGSSTDAHWVALQTQLPEAYRLSSGHLRIPIDDVEGATLVHKGPAELEICGCGEVSLSTCHSPDWTKHLSRFLADACERRDRRNRDEAPVADPEASRLEELWAVAKEIPWLRRVWKQDLKPVAVMLRPEEEVIGVAHLALAATGSCAVTVTDRCLHLSTGSPGGSRWKALAAQLPSSYTVSSDYLRIPLGDLESAPKVVNGHPEITLRGGVCVPLSAHRARENAELIERYVIEALARGPVPEA